MKKLKILFDTTPACREDMTGIPLFVKHLYDALSEIEGIEIEKTLCVSEYIPRKHWKLFRFFEKIIYQKLYLPFKLKFGKYDVYVENQYIFDPLFIPKETYVVTFVYDIALALFEGLQTDKHTQNWRRKLPIGIKNSNLLMTISKTSKRDIETYLQIQKLPSIPVEYIYADVDKLHTDQIDTKSVLSKYKIEKGYFLFLGTLEPRKNPLKIVEGFHRFKKENANDIKLVFAGKKGWLYEDVISYIEKHKLSDDVIFTGYVSQEEKSALLQHTKAFLFLSVYEGFGMPALEALQMGTPTLLSDIPVFHELYEESVYYADHTNSEEIALQMQKILQTPPSIDVDLFKKFSWQRSAEDFVEIMQKHIS